MRLVGAFLTLSALTACHEKIISDDAPPPSASMTAPLATTPPTLPPDAMGNSSSAAKAFVKHWFAAFNYASQSGDVHALARLSSERCLPCQAIITKITRTYSAGGYTKSTGWSVDHIRVATPAMIRARIVTQPQEVVTEEGAQVQRFPGETFAAGISLDRKGRQWLLLDLVRI